MLLRSSNTKRRPPELLSQRLFNLLRLLDREARDTLKKVCDLRILDWRILASVAQSSHITVRALADLLFVSRSEACRSAAVLVKRGLILRLEDPEDGRSCLFQITAKGRAVYRRVLPLRQAFMNGIINKFTKEERDCFNNVLDRLTGFLDTQQDSA